MIVSTETLVTNPRMMPARSEMKKMCCCSSSPRASEIAGSDTVGSVGSGGDWVGPPPSIPVKNRAARYLARPAPMMFSATPETMWSTPNTTVATAWITPPTMPPMMPPMMPAQAPHSTAQNAAPQVPRIIMPSRPMLTTPARSDQRPPRPARPIGTARPIAAAMAPEEAMSFGPVTTRRIEMTRTTPAA